MTSSEEPLATLPPKRVDRAYHIAAKDCGWVLEGQSKVVATTPFNDGPNDTLHSITTFIEPPNEEDPGQLLELRKNVVDLVVYLLIYLRRGMNPPEIHILLVDTTSLSWYDGNKHPADPFPKFTVPDLGIWDIEVALMPFMYLRPVRLVTITTPLQSYKEDVWFQDHIQEDIIDLMMSTKRTHRPKWHEELREELDVPIVLDFELDRLAGPTRAAMAVEDAATLAECLKRLRSKDELRHAVDIYERLRILRCKLVQEASLSHGYILHYPDGPLQQARDAAMKPEVEGKPFIASPNQWSDPTSQLWCYTYDPVEDVRRNWKCS